MPNYTPEEANNDCRGCEYHLTDMEFTQTQSSDNTDIIKSDQTCGRVLKRKPNGDFTTEGCEDCGSKSEAECTDPHCEWKEGIEKCVLGTIGGDCTLLGCHQKCQYPFRSQDAYTTGGNILQQGEFNDDNIVSLSTKIEQITRLSDPGMYSKTGKYYNSQGEIFDEDSTLQQGVSLSTDLTQGVYGGMDITEGENCGSLKRPSDEYVNHHVKFPDPPDFDDFLEIVKNQMELTGEINWFAINPISYGQLDNILGGTINSDNTTITINDITIPFSNNGISLQWWNNDSQTGELVDPSDERISQLGDEEAIINKTFGSDNPLYDYLTTNPPQNHDFTRICEQQIRDADISSVLSTSEEDNFIFSFLLNVGPDAEQNRSFERCMNRLMRTPGDNDKEMVPRIKSLDSISELGIDSNSELLDYVERKIKKFLSLTTSQFDKCIEKIEISDNICSQGLFPNAMDMLGQILNMETGRKIDPSSGDADTDNEQHEQNIKVVSDRLLKYVPELLKKILEISTTYETDYCGMISPKTQLLKEIYDNLFKKEISLNIPDLGLGGFFDDFSDYGIVGKIVLMMFFVFILTQVVSLFKVNVAVSN
jgi:hypothetical protein